MTYKNYSKTLPTKVRRETGTYARFKRLGSDLYQAHQRLKFTKYDHRGNPVRLDQTRSSESAPAVRNIGRSTPNTDNKTFVIESERSALNTNTLYQIDCTNIPRNSASNFINYRNRDTILFKGLRIDGLFRNDATNPVYVRCALVNRKNGEAPSTTDFFRGYGDRRGADFVSGGDIAALRMRSDPINTDEYNVFKSWQFTLSPSTANTDIGYNREDAANWRDISEYVKINRHLNYDGPGGTTCTERIYFVYWFALGYSTQTMEPLAGAVDRQMRIVAFFNDGSNAN